jgi:hypothetical protein
MNGLVCFFGSEWTDEWIDRRMYVSTGGSMDLGREIYMYVCMCECVREEIYRRCCFDLGCD